MKKGNGSLLVMAALIVVAGLAIFGGVLAMRVSAATGTAAATIDPDRTFNNSGSYGFDDSNPNTTATNAMAAQQRATNPVAITVTKETPKFVKQSLKAKTPFVVFVYCQGTPNDMDLLASFNKIRAKYGSSADFYPIEAKQTKRLGDVFDKAQLNISDPPMTALVDGKGEMFELYTGWISEAVLEQRVADLISSD